MAHYKEQAHKTRVAKHSALGCGGATFKSHAHGGKVKHREFGGDAFNESAGLDMTDSSPYTPESYSSPDASSSSGWTDKQKGALGSALSAFGKNASTMPKAAQMNVLNPVHLATGPMGTATIPGMGGRAFKKGGSTKHRKP